MTKQLTAHLYDNDLSSPAFIKNLTGRVRDIRLLWELHGGLQAVELEWAGTLAEAFDFYQQYVGYRLLVADSYCDTPVADGFITGLALGVTGVHILANGAWFRHYDQLYNFDTTVQDYQQGTLSYESGNEFRDTGQDFSDWDTASGSAAYQIVVTNIGEPNQEVSSTIDTDNDFATSGGLVDRVHYGQRFVPSESGKLAKVSVKLKKTGAPTGSIQIQILVASAGAPGGIAGPPGSVVVASGAVAASSLSTSYAWVDFTWGSNGPTLYADAAYFIKIYTTDYTYSDGVTEIVLGSDADGSSGDTLLKYNPLGSPGWTTVGTDHSSNYRIYTCTENTITWGFLGTVGAGGNTYIKVYEDWDLGANGLGWFGPDVSTLAPIAYEVVAAYAPKSTGDIVKEAVNDPSLGEVPVMASSQDNIDDPGTVIGFWEPPIEEGGMYPGELIEKLASWSDGSNQQWNYWTKNQPFDGVLPQKPLPYFKAQLSDGSYDYQIYRWMLRPGSLSMERNIQELRNTLKVIFRNMEQGDSLDVVPTDSWLTDSDSVSNYWTREVFITAGDSVPAVADQYGDLYLDKFKDALLGKSITITAPFILDDGGNQWPLWYPCKLSKSYFRFVDFYPDAALFDESWNRKTCAQATTMEYSSRNNSLRLVLDLEDNALDALLARISAFR